MLLNAKGGYNSISNIQGKSEGKKPYNFSVLLDASLESRMRRESKGK